MSHKVELKITHRQFGRDLGHYKISSQDEVVVIGSSPNAKIRILDDKISDVHACIEFRNSHWHVIDLSDGQGTRVNKKSIHEISIQDKMTLDIGDTELLIQPVKIYPYELYSKNTPLNLGEDFGKLVQAQQVVIFQNSKIIKSEIVSLGKKIKLSYCGEKHKFSPAVDENWVEDTIGRVTIRRRNITVPMYKDSKSSRIGHTFSKDILYSFGLAFGIAALFFLSIWWMDKVSPKKQVLQKNKYTRMIFDAEVIKRQRSVAKEAQKKKKFVAKKKKKPKIAKKKLVKKKPASLAKKKPKISKEVRKTLDRLKKYGLGKKISKIIDDSTIDNTVLLKSVQKGVSKARSKTFINSGSIIYKNKRKLKKKIESYNIKDISTKGVSATESKKLSGLSPANVGKSGIVGAIEEETEISAGMDPEVIRSIVKKSMGRIRYCYERQLITTPGLSGQIKLSWIINSQGRVASPKVQRSTMKSAMTEGCILRVIKRLNFPRPDSGGDVLVAFPFYFKAGT